MTEVDPLIPPENVAQSVPVPSPIGGESTVMFGGEATGSRGFWGEAWRRFRRRKLAMLALLFVCFLVLVAIFSPFIVGSKPIACHYKGVTYYPVFGYYNPNWENAIFSKPPFFKKYKESLFEKDPKNWVIYPLVYQDPFRRIGEGERENIPENRSGDQGAPDKFSWFGTDQNGIDVFAQMVHGTTTALLVGFVSMGIAAAIGIPLGAMAGYFGGFVDVLLSRILEVVMCIPSLVLILAMIAIIEKPSIWYIMAVLGLTGWTGIARLTRAEFLKLRNSEFTTAARALGAGPLRIIFRHILPNALAPILVPITFGIASAILTESALSFLGLGGSGASWGKVLSSAQSNLAMWWLIVFPGGAIFLAVLAYNLIGEGIQEATDPRLREAGK